MQRDYAQLMESVDFMLDQMTVIRRMSKEVGDKHLARRLAMRADKIEGWAVAVQLLAMGGGTGDGATSPAPSESK